MTPGMVLNWTEGAEISTEETVAWLQLMNL